MGSLAKFSSDDATLGKLLLGTNNVQLQRLSLFRDGLERQNAKEKPREEVQTEGKDGYDRGLQERRDQYCERSKQEEIRTLQQSSSTRPEN